MSKKSAYRRSRQSHDITADVITVLPQTWNELRTLAGCPLTGEPLAFAQCLALEQELDKHPEHFQELQRFLIILIVEAWRQSFPAPPRKIIMTE